MSSEKQDNQPSYKISIEKQTNGIKVNLKDPTNSLSDIYTCTLQSLNQSTSNCIKQLHFIQTFEQIEHQLMSNNYIFDKENQTLSITARTNTNRIVTAAKFLLTLIKPNFHTILQTIADQFSRQVKQGGMSKKREYQLLSKLAECMSSYIKQCKEMKNEKTQTKQNSQNKQLIKKLTKNQQTLEHQIEKLRKQLNEQQQNLNELQNKYASLYTTVSHQQLPIRNTRSSKIVIPSKPMLAEQQQVKQQEGSGSSQNEKKGQSDDESAQSESGSRVVKTKRVGKKRGKGRGRGRRGKGRGRGRAAIQQNSENSNNQVEAANIEQIDEQVSEHQVVVSSSNNNNSITPNIDNWIDYQTLPRTIRIRNNILTTSQQPGCIYCIRPIPLGMYKYGIEIKQISNIIQIGIIQKQYAGRLEDQRSQSSYSSVFCRKFSCSSSLVDGIYQNFGVGDVVVVTVCLAQGTIQWAKNGSSTHFTEDQAIRDSNIKWIPFIKLSKKCQIALYPPQTLPQI